MSVFCWLVMSCFSHLDLTYIRHVCQFDIQLGSKGCNDPTEKLNFFIFMKAEYFRPKKYVMNILGMLQIEE